MKNLQDFIDELFDFAMYTFGCWSPDKIPTERLGIRVYVGDWAEAHNKDYCWKLTDSELDEVIDAVVDLLLD